MILRVFIGGGQEHPKAFEYHHAEFQHEVVVLSIARTTANIRKYASGTPIRIEWGISATMKATFIGYVSHIDPKYDVDRHANGEERELDVVCLGPSYVMKDGGYLTRKAVSASTMAREVAALFRFDPTFIQNHPTLLSLAAQAGRSHLVFLNEMAKECGYTHYVRGLSLCFHDRLTALSTQGTPPRVSPRRMGGTLLKFDSSLGDGTATGGDLAQRMVTGINPRTGQTFVVNSAPAQRPLLGQERVAPRFAHGETTMVVDSYAAGADALAAQAGNNELSLQAQVHALGNPFIRVGGATDIRGIDVINDGLWYVSKVCHRIKAPDTFETIATLGRDAYVGVALPSRATQQVSRGARLLSNQWVLA